MADGVIPGPHVAAISYAVCALGFALLLLLLLTRWRGRSKGTPLVIAVAISVAWALAATFATAHAPGDRAPVALYQIGEVLRSLAWLALLFELLKPLLDGGGRGSGAGAYVSLRRLFYPAIAAFAALLLALELSGGGPLEALTAYQLSVSGHLLLAVAGLTLIEHLFRNTRPENRWATKFLYLGLGALFAFDFFLYADALLLQTVNENIWAARGGVNALAVPLIAVSASRNPGWSLEIFVSRQMVVHSVTVIGAGLYLLAMSLAGYYIRYIGGGWGGAMQMVFFAAAVLLLAALLFSGHLRALIKVFLSKHFFYYKYDYRDEWLRFSETLSETNAATAPRERAVRAIAQIFYSPSGLLWVRGAAGRFENAAGWNVAPPAKPGALDGLVAFLDRTRWVIDLDSYRNDPETYPRLTLPTWLSDDAWWIVVPLSRGSDLAGFIVLTRPPVAARLNWEDWDLLKTAGRQIASYIALLDATDALVDAREFDAFNRLSAYVVHDLKNVAAQLALVVANAEKHKTNPAFVDDAIATVANATARMNRMLAQLRGDGGAPDAPLLRFDLAAALDDALGECARRRPRPTLSSPVPAGAQLLADRDRFVAVVVHLLHNAQEATDAAGSVTVDAAVDHAAGTLRLTIEDSGRGMSAAFIRDGLFRPFVTTKGNAGMGIGAYESREFATALGGGVEVDSEPGRGTRFTLTLPLAARSSYRASPAGVDEAAAELSPGGRLS